MHTLLTSEVTLYINKHQTFGKAITEMGLQAIKMSQHSRLQTTEL